MTNKKHFPKNISQWEFDFGLFTNLPIIIVARDFSPSFSLFLWLFLTKYVSNLKTTCHVKLKIFSWTKLLEWTCLLLASKELNSLLAKYLISVTAPLNTFVNSPFFKTCKKWSIACAFLRSEKLTGRVKLYSTRNSNHRLCFRLKISTVV